MHSRSRLPEVALLWSQFAAYHVDRCEAVARRLEGRAEVLAVEVASSSAAYAWEPSGKIAGARKVTLFPRQAYESIPRLKRLAAQFRALRRCRMVFIGIGYDQPDIIALSWLLWLCGGKVVLLSDSKFDDYARTLGFEVIKSLLFAPYGAAIVAGRRHMSYLRLLGFRRRTVLPGYDGVSIERIRAQAGGALAPGGSPYAARPFIYVGRFVEKKNLLELVDGFAGYAKATAAPPRRLVLVGSGPLEGAIRQRASELGITGYLDFPGFLGAQEVSRLLADALALVLVSSVEQWGLVVNEALAFGLPAIVSGPVGSRDALVRNLVNGYVLENGSIEGLARAMTSLAENEMLWRAMVEASHSRAWMGDVERLADAAETLLEPGAQPAVRQIARFLEELGQEPQRGSA